MRRRSGLRKPKTLCDLAAGQFGIVSEQKQDPWRVGFAGALRKPCFSALKVSLGDRS